MKAKADELRVTGTIQRYVGDDVHIVFEGTRDTHFAFLGFLKSEVGRMIESFENPQETNREFSYYDSFTILCDFSRTEARGGKTRKGMYSNEEHDKLSTLSADRLILRA